MTSVDGEICLKVKSKIDSDLKRGREKASGKRTITLSLWTKLKIKIFYVKSHFNRNLLPFLAKSNRRFYLTDQNAINMQCILFETNEEQRKKTAAHKQIWLRFTNTGTKIYGVLQTERICFAAVIFCFAFQWVNVFLKRQICLLIFHVWLLSPYSACKKIHYYSKSLCWLFQCWWAKLFFPELRLQKLKKN